MFFFGILFLGTTHMPDLVAARFCEGGHICSLPRECCTQGCCPPYQSQPRLPPPSEHVLNLFFISHWFFWCVVVAIILAILCAYSLWKKRRSLCGWGFPENRAQSEGDSAGSCYAPPQYSRCSSFHHPPPPYTEVTSKPDLYPLVFTCNSDNGKTGSSYLMVQYFRNYIVRPAGSLSAASTVDSLSSSFICNVNEANTLVPPPYSRAASPEMGYSTSFQHHYVLPRSASQLVCPNGQPGNGSPQNMYNQTRASHYTNAVVLTGGAVGGGDENAIIVTPFHAHHLDCGESENFERADSSDSKQSVLSVDDGNDLMHNRRLDGFTQSQSDQHFRYNVNSNSSISDIFVNSNCTSSAIAGGEGGMDSGYGGGAIVNHNGLVHCEQEPQTLSQSDPTATSIRTTKSFIPTCGGTPVIFSNGSIKPNPLHRTSTNPTQLANEQNRDAVYNSCNSIGGISITMPNVTDNTSNVESEFTDLRTIRRSLETCCKMLQQQQQQQQHHMPPVGSPLRNFELLKKYTDEGLRSYMTSATCSGVSSLANIGTPSSPPQATSPTGEVKEILDQIRQLQDGVNYDDFLLNSRPVLHHTMSSPSSGSELQSKRHSADTSSIHLQRYATMPEQQNPTNHDSPTSRSPTFSSNSLYGAAQKSPDYANRTTTTQTATAIATAPATAATGVPANKRPSSLQQSKKKFCSPKPNRAMYIPMTAAASASSNRCILKSPVGSMVSANFFTTRARVRKGWISRSAPTTPGTCLPTNCMGDDSPLLNEHEEDQEGEQNAEME